MTTVRMVKNHRESQKGKELKGKNKVQSNSGVSQVEGLGLEGSRKEWKNG